MSERRKAWPWWAAVAAVCVIGSVIVATLYSRSGSSVRPRAARGPNTPGEWSALQGAADWARSDATVKADHCIATKDCSTSPREHRPVGTMTMNDGVWTFSTQGALYEQITGPAGESFCVEFPTDVDGRTMWAPGPCAVDAAAMAWAPFTPGNELLPTGTPVVP